MTQPFDLKSMLAEHEAERFVVYDRYVNHQLVRVLRTIGFDRHYVRGEGCYLYDEDGQRYLDFLSGFGVFALGRSHPVVKQALHDALDADLANLVQLDAPLLAGLLARELVGRSHEGIERVVFANSGAEAVESAMKFARAATRRPRLCYASHAFHGLTMGALSLNGGKEFREGFGALLAGCDPVPFGDAPALEKELARRDVAAFVVEPIQGKGVNEAPATYWEEVQELCRRYGTLLVMDEVQVGMGRTGAFFCHQHWGLEPDIITVSKALSAGYVPVGAMLCTAAVHDKVFSSIERAVVHSSTFAKNQLGMVAGLATLHVLDNEHVIEHVRESGERFMKALRALQERFELLVDVRGMGYMIGLELGQPSSFSQRSRWRLIELTRSGLFSQLIVVPLFHRHHILTQVAGDNMNVVKLLPPLIAGDTEIDMFVEAFSDVLDDAGSFTGIMRSFGKPMVKSALRRSPR